MWFHRRIIVEDWSRVAVSATIDPYRRGRKGIPMRTGSEEGSHRLGC